MDYDLKPLAVLKDVDKPWLEKMLMNKFGKPISIDFWSCKVPDTPEGFMSELAYLDITYIGCDKEKVSLQLVIKVLPQEQVRRKAMAVGGLDVREVAFYEFVNCSKFQELCNDNNVVVQVPLIYYARFLGEDVTLIMQDLRVGNYKSGIVKEGNSLSQTKVAVQAIAEFHAAGLAFIKKYGEEGIPSVLLKEFKFTCFEHVFGPNLKNLAKTYEGLTLAPLIISMIPHTLEILDMLKKYPLIRTVVHGDYWAGQLMYSADESSVMMLDWQHCHVGNPTLDIVTILFMSSHPNVLENHLEDVLICYWDSLCSNAQKVGVSLDVTLDQFKKNVDDLMIFGFMAIAISIPEFLGGGNLTPKRLQGYVEYLERKDIVTKFLKTIKK